VIACAGNTGSSRPFWPAALPTVIAVGALDGGARAAFSAHGPWVDAWAQGVGLTSSFLEFGRFRGYAPWSGASFAAALATGPPASLWASSGAAPAARPPAPARGWTPGRRAWG